MNGTNKMDVININDIKVSNNNNYEKKSSFERNVTLNIPTL